MMNPRARVVVVVLLTLLALVAAGCGDGSGSGDDEGASTKDDTTQEAAEPEVPVTKTIVAKPLSATEDLLVMEGPDGEEMTFNVRPDDARMVDPTHVASHVGIPTLAFEISYEEVDGELYATGAREVSVEAAQQ